MDRLHRQLTDRIINVFYAVYDELGAGFLEKICQTAMVMALRSAGFRVQERVPFEVCFRGELIGSFIADIVVEGLILIEIKSKSALISIDEAQALNYLRVSDLEVASIMNFGPSRTSGAACIPTVGKPREARARTWRPAHRTRESLASVTPAVSGATVGLSVWSV
jgi:GxxExxY protein